MADHESAYSADGAVPHPPSDPPSASRVGSAEDVGSQEAAGSQQGAGDAEVYALLRVSNPDPDGHVIISSIASSTRIDVVVHEPSTDDRAADDRQADDAEPAGSSGDVAGDRVFCLAGGEVDANVCDLVLLGMRAQALRDQGRASAPGQMGATTLEVAEVRLEGPAPEFIYAHPNSQTVQQFTWEPAAAMLALAISELITDGIARDITGDDV